MASNLPPFTIIPAAAGFRVIYSEDSGEIFVAEDVIAWRVETEVIRDEYHSTVTPISIDGDPGSNWLGLLQPNGKVSIMGTEYDTLEAAAAARKEQAA